MVTFQIQPCPSIAVNKRKQCFILRTIFPIIFFIIGTLLFLGPFRKFSHHLMKNSSNMVQLTKSIKSSLEEEVEEFESVRKPVLKENTDEFLETVLSEVSYTEVDLRLHRQLNLHANYDKDILNFENKVVPGLGEGGEKGTVPPSRKKQEAEVMKMEAFNRLLSEMIAVNRTVPDTREATCRNFTYLETELPSISVIIPFTNEALISIVRLIHSLINRTPGYLLEEVILVDDFSDPGDLKEMLERYLITKFPVHKIRLIRLSTRSGLIRARMIGAHVAVGDVLVFLDAHCEVGHHWSEPLLERIKEKRTAVVSPVIDGIGAETLEYQAGNGELFYVEGFKWSGHLYWIGIPEHEKNRKRFHWEPTRTPVMAGGLFAVDRKYFWEMGSYDPGMEIWGGENLEMSLRIWQCGGSVEVLPCSRVGHIFRPFRPYSFNTTNESRNILRAATVWMDQYKSLLSDKEAVGIGDNVTLQRRIAFRKRKNCKSFEWYLDNIYKTKFKMMFDSKHWGQVKNTEFEQCLDVMENEEEEGYRLQVYPCHSELYPSQTYYLSKKNELRKELVCAVGQTKGQVLMRNCDDAKDDAFYWEYDKFGRIRNQKSGECLGISETIMEPERYQYQVVLERCNFLTTQRWTFENYTKSLLVDN